MVEEEESTSHPVNLMDFVSAEQLEEAKKSRGKRVEDGTAQRDRPLYEILNENKAKMKAELNDRRKHQPPKSLDEDEVNFLDEWEMYKRANERQLALEEAHELRRFREAVSAQTQCLPPSALEANAPAIGRKNPASHPLSSILKVVPLAKKDVESVAESSDTVKNVNVDKSLEPAGLKINRGDADKSDGLANLVSYGSIAKRMVW